MADGWVQVYPTLVIRGTGLYELWKKGLYHNYEPTLLIDLVARILALVPPWVRVYRIQVMLTTPISIITVMQAAAHSSGMPSQRHFTLLLLSSLSPEPCVVGTKSRPNLI